MTQILLQISSAELCQSEHIHQEHIVELVEYGIVTPTAGINVNEWVFDTTSAYWIKKAIRLHRDLDLEWFAVALAIDLIRENESLRNEMITYKKQLARLMKQH